MGGLLSEMTVKYAVDISSLTSGITQAKSSIASVSDATTQATAALKQMSGAADMSKTISGVDVARANLTLLESKVTEARDKLQTLQNAADAGQAVKGIPEAEAGLTLLEAKAQDARAKLQELEAEEQNAGSAAMEMASQEERAAESTSSFSERAGGLLSGIKGAVGGLIDFGSRVGMTVMGIQGLAQGAANLAGSILEPAASLEQVRSSLEVFTGSSQKAESALNDLSSFASHTPFETGTIDQAALKLMSVGINAKDSITDLQSLGDSLDAVGRTSSADMGMIVDTFMKIKTEGKLTSAAMGSFAAQGVDAWSVLQKQTGKTHAELQAMISGGLYPADKAMHDLTVGIEANPLYKGQMANDANVFNGALSTLKSNWDQVLAAFGSPVIKALEPLMSQLASTLSSPAFKEFASVVGQQLVNSLSSVAKVTLQAGQFLGSTLLPPLQHLGAVMQPLVTSFAQWAASSNQAGSSFSVLGNAVSGLVVGLAGLINGMATFIGWLRTGGAPAEAVRAALIGIAVAIAAIQIGNFIATLPALLAGLAAWAVEQWAVAAATIATAAPYILIGAAIAIVVAIIILAITHWGEIAHWLQGVWAAFAVWFVSAMQATGAFFVALWAGMQAGLQAAWAVIVQVVQVGAQLLYQAFVGPFLAIGQLFQWLYQHNTYFQQLIDSITSITQAGMAWLQSAWTASVTFISAQWQRLVGFASSIWNAIASAVSSGVQVAVSFLQTQWGIAAAWIQAQWARIASFAQVAWAAVSRVFASIWGTYIAGPMNSLWGQFTGWFSNLAGLATRSGQNFISMLASGITSGAGAIWNAVSGIANTIWKALGFHSPAKEGPASDADRWMPNLVDMLSTSLVAGIPKMQSAALATAQPLRAFAPSSAGTAAIVAASSGGSGVGGGGYGGEQHIHLDVDGQELTHLVMKHTDRIVKLKLGSKGRIA